MKTKLFLIATLFISTITFSQTTKKGYDYYKASINTKMNKGELIDAMAKDGNLVKRGTKRRTKGFGASDISEIEKRTGRNPQTGKAIKNARSGYGLPTGKRAHRSQGDPIPGIDITVEQGFQDGTDLHIRKRPGRTKYGTKISTEGQAHRGNDKPVTKRPGRTKYKKSSATSVINPPIPTKATDYNSSRSNKSY